MASRRVLLGTLLALVAASCTGANEAAKSSAADALPPAATKFFTAAYDQISDKYVRQVALPTLTNNGLSGLSSIDSGLAVASNGRYLELRENGALVGKFEMPADEEARRWAQLTVDMVDAGRAASPALRTASSEQIYQAVLDNALSKLDRYSRYAGQEQARESRANRDGFGGIGIVIDTETGSVRVRSVMAGTPAELAGIKLDDQITHIDSDSTNGLSSSEIVRRLRGPIGSDVTVRVARPGVPDPLSMTLTRALIVPVTITYKRDGNVAHVRLTGFNHRTTAMLTEAIRRAKRETGGNLGGIVIDLRGNLGGLLDQAVSVADLFLASGTIVTTRGRHRASSQMNEASRGDIGEDIPLAVLVNSSSASAAEIVAAALQDNGRAVVIGTASFGKGSVQTVIPLPNDGELVLTWAGFHAPSGYPLQDLGIMPTVCTAGMPADAAAIVADIRQGRMTSPSTMVEWRTAPHTDKVRMNELRARCQPEAQDRDTEVEVARRLLTDRALYARTLNSVSLAAKAR